MWVCLSCTLSSGSSAVSSPLPSLRISGPFRGDNKPLEVYEIDEFKKNSLDPLSMHPSSVSMTLPPTPTDPQADFPRAAIRGGLIIALSLQGEFVAQLCTSSIDGDEVLEAWTDSRHFCGWSSSDPNLRSADMHFCSSSSDPNLRSADTDSAHAFARGKGGWETAANV